MGVTGRAKERGGSYIKALVWLAIFAAFVFSAIKTVPVYWAKYMLEDSMREEARFALANRRDPEQVRIDVYKKARELGVPAKMEDIRVENAEGAVRITVNYPVVIDLLVYQWRQEFHSTADSNSV